MQNFKEKAINFLSPFKPLGQAFVIFFKTSTGIVVVCVIGVIIVGKIVMLNGHKNSDRRFDHNDSFFWQWEGMKQDKSSKRDMFSQMNEELKRMDRMMNEHQKIMQDRMNDAQKFFDQKDLQKLELGTGASQSISQYSETNGKSIGYTLQIQNNTLQGTITGNTTQDIIENFKKENITLTGWSFSLPYTIENLDKVVKILERK